MGPSHPNNHGALGQNFLEPGLPISPHCFLRLGYGLQRVLELCSELTSGVARTAVLARMSVMGREID